MGSKHQDSKTFHLEEYNFLVAGALALAIVSWTSAGRLEIKTCGPEWAIPTASRSRVEGARSCPETERAGPAWSESPKGADIEEESAPRTTSGMARTGLRLGDGHRSPSPCTGLPESAWLVEMRTASCPAKGEWAHLCPEVPGNSGRTKAGIGMTPVMQRGPLPLCQTNPKSGLLFDGSISTTPTWASVSTESRLQGLRLPEHETLTRRGICPESKGGDSVHACLGCATVNLPDDLYGILPPCCLSLKSPPERGEKVN